MDKIDKAFIYILRALGLAIILLILFTGLARGAEVDTTKAVIHHTASFDVSANTIDRWHKARGWDEIGYHFVIRANGDIEEGRPLTKKGAHAKGRNHYVGIALTGFNDFTAMQIKSLRGLLIQLGVRKVERHHENCPGSGLNLELIQKGLDKYYGR